MGEFASKFNAAKQWGDGASMKIRTYVGECVKVLMRSVVVVHLHHVFERWIRLLVQSFYEH